MNGQSIVELSHDSIVQLIKDAGATVTLTVIAEEGKNGHPPPHGSEGHSLQHCQGRCRSRTVPYAGVSWVCLCHLVNLNVYSEVVRSSRHEASERWPFVRVLEKQAPEAGATAAVSGVSYVAS